MEIKLINCFSCVISTNNFQRLKVLLVSLLFFIAEYIFLKQVVKLLMVKYTYLLYEISQVIFFTCLFLLKTRVIVTSILPLSVLIICKKHKLCSYLQRKNRTELTESANKNVNDT